MMRSRSGGVGLHAGRLALLGCAWLAGAGWSGAAAQGPARERAALVVEGNVAGVYRDVKAGTNEYVIEVSTTKAELGAGARGRLVIPGAGEPVYVKLATEQPNRSIPSVGSTVRVYLTLTQNGEWTAAGNEWAEVLRGGVGGFEAKPASEPAPPTAPAPAPPEAPAGRGGTVDQILGIESEQIQAGGRVVLRVKKLVPGGPAAESGIEPEDVILGINRETYANVEGFANGLKKAGSEAVITVLDPKRREPVDVKVALGSAAAPVNDAAVPRRSLGVAVEVVEIGNGKRGLKVNEVQVGSPAQRAGIEVGDVLVAAGNAALDRPEALAQAVKASGAVLPVVVLNVRDGSAVQVEVAMGAAAAPGNAGGGAAGAGGYGAAVKRLGVATEPDPQQLIPSLRVTQVIPGSPAARAGIEVGDVIFAANDTVTITPDLLDQAVAKSGAVMKLNMLNARTNRKVEVEVPLGVQ
jgi:S1-C subfamily serine protease